MLKRVIAALCALALMLTSAALADGGVADASDMTDVIDIVPEGMTPVTGDQLNDGVYVVDVDVSSSMFKVNGAILTVEDGRITARLLMNSSAYTYMYPGAAEDAAAADESDWNALEEDDEYGYSFVLPINALDEGFECAAYSARKELWYPRLIVFRADSLPLEAWKPEYLTTASSLGLEEGEYTCAVALSGAGRATLDPVTWLTVQGGETWADILFSTAKIDYVIVDGEKYEPTQTEGNAAFTVPVAAFDLPLNITVDSTAIKPAVEVAYTMTFDSATISKP